MGVDVFFVLSGYLITSLLIREINFSGRVALRKFYIRRFLRLTPAFWTLLFVISVMTALFAAKRGEGFQAVLISAVYLMNWNRAFHLFPEGLLAHTWSLSMEEQFYVLWPSVLLVINHRRPIRWTLIIIAAMTIWRIYLALSGADPDRTYNGFDTHGDALLIGCVLALAPMALNAAALARTLVALPIIGVILMLREAALQTLFTQTLGLSLASLLSAWLIVGALQPGWFRQVLSVHPLVYTGRISYGWYLWHAPFLLLGAKSPFLQSGSGKTLLVLMAYSVAACSYHFVEQPFLRLKSRFEPKESKYLTPPPDEDAPVRVTV